VNGVHAGAGALTTSLLARIGNLRTELWMQGKRLGVAQQKNFIRDAFGDLLGVVTHFILHRADDGAFSVFEKD
jgi:hypothetical protein